jgi:hypothetical protein
MSKEQVSVATVFQICILELQGSKLGQTSRKPYLMFNDCN